MRFRRKLRIRHYETDSPLAEDPPVFVEIKQRLDRVTQKRRVILPYGEALVMMIVGSNIARAFSLVGAFSIIRFRNAVKETRDVGFIFFVMAIGMAIGAKFYLLAAAGAIVISLMIVIMMRFDWFARDMASHILRIHVPNGVPFDALFDKPFVKYTNISELISVDTIQNGAMTELTYSIGLKKSNHVQEFLSELRSLNGGNKITLIAGYNSTDL